MNADWPQTVRVGGETYILHPEMSLAAYLEVTGAFKTEADTLCELADAMGIATPEDFGATGAGEDYR